MTIHRFLISTVVCVALASSCAQKKDLIPADYTTWERTVKEVLKYPIPGHISSYRKIYINETGEKTTETKDKNGRDTYLYPDGTIIVKELYDAATYTDNSKPQSLTVMIKDAKDPLARGGWLWIMKALPDGKERIIGSSFCITCHANANEPHPYGDHNPDGDFRDYVFLPYQNEEQDPK
jgi:hypothetical protein